MSSKFPLTPKTEECLAFARREAGRLRHPEVRVGHILLGILRHGDSFAAEVIQSAGIDTDDLVRRVQEHLGPPDDGPLALDIPFSQETLRFFGEVNIVRKKLRHDWVGTDHFLMIMTSPSWPQLASLLQDAGLTHGAVINAFATQRSGGESPVTGRIDLANVPTQVIDQETGKPISLRHVLVDEKGLSEEEFFEVMATHFGFEFMPEDQEPPEAEFAARFDADLVREAQILPLRLEDETLYTATYDPFRGGWEKLREELGIQVVRLLAPRDWVVENLERLYPED